MWPRVYIKEYAKFSSRCYDFPNGTDLRNDVIRFRTMNIGAKRQFDSGKCERVYKIARRSNHRIYITRWWKNPGNILWIGNI